MKSEISERKPVKVFVYYNSTMIYVWPPSPLHTLLQCVLNFFAPLVPSLCPYLLLWCRLVFRRALPLQYATAAAPCQHSLIHALQWCAAATASFHARRRCHCPGTWKQNFGYKVCSYPHNRFNEILATIWLYSNIFRVAKFQVFLQK